MIGFDNNIKYELFSDELERLTIPEPVDYDTGNADVIELDEDRGTFKTTKASDIQVYGEAYDYLDAIVGVYGTLPDVRLLESRKDPRRRDERFRLVSDVGIDLSTCEFDRERKVVKFSTVEGGFLQTIESSFSDEFDITLNESIDGKELDELRTVQVKLDPRQILRRSRLEVEDGTEVRAVVSGGDRLNARAIPFKVDYNNDRNDVQEVFGTDLNAFDDRYATVTAVNSQNLIYRNANTDTKLTLNGKVKTVITVGNSGTFSLDIVRYNNGGELNFAEVIQTLDTCNPNQVGAVCEFEFVDYVVEIQKGDSFAIATLSDTSDGVAYEVFETSLIITENDEYPQTYTKAVKVFDLFERLIAIITGKQNAFRSEIFGSSGKYENILIAHGTWLRNMPSILNEGEEDERKIQVNVGLEDLFKAMNINEPLVYGVSREGNDEFFYVKTEKETLQNFTAIQLGEKRDGFVELLSVSDENGVVMGDNYHRSIKLGSNTSGGEYGEVNNLYSTCGNATWTTINVKSESKYEVTTDYRTGAEDIELTRQLQYSENPDIDSERDDDLFMIDAKPFGGEYHLKKWDDYFSEPPKKVYSYETNYNWRWIPSMLLDGHGWKINSSLHIYPNESLSRPVGNCDLSFITKREGSEERAEDARVPHSLLEPPKFAPMMLEFKLQLNDDIEDALKGTSFGFDNKEGLIRYKKKDGTINIGYLIKVDKNDQGNWELIQAIRNV